jgi:hypothetical protein
LSWALLKKFTDQLHHFALIGVTTGLQLGIYQAVVYRHLKTTANRRNQRQRFDLGFESVEQIYHQTGGAVGVMSNLTIDHLDFH